MEKSTLRLASVLVVVLASLMACDGPFGAGQAGVTGDLVAARASATAMARINVILDGPVTDARLAALAAIGTVKDQIPELNAVMVQGKGLSPASFLDLPFVAAANYDAERSTGPVSPIATDSMVTGISTWDLDAVDVTDPLVAGRCLAQDGSGVYVAVLDTGLVDGWQNYFPVQRIATQYAKAFGGGGGENGNVSEPTNKWEHDQDSHGTHVTSTILGYSRFGLPVNGVAPMATVIPVKVLNQNGSGWSSVIAQGIMYVAGLKAGPLAASPVVINMSLGGSALDAVEKAAIDFAIARGVIVVASAGNEGGAGMGYPGAYGPVISVAASGWTGEWKGGRSWWLADVPDPASPEDFYIADFSSRALPGQDLDLAAPGSWIVGPYQTNGQMNYYYLGGTSMASPHVAGAVALLCQKYPGLTAAVAEALLESTALPLAAGSRMVTGPDGVAAPISWGRDATGAGLLNLPAALAALP
jgi:subtilisin family serine protease